jgi:hypothetical protein
MAATVLAVSVLLVGVSIGAGVSVSTSADSPTEPTTAVPFPAVTPGQAPY